MPRAAYLSENTHPFTATALIRMEEQIEENRVEREVLQRAADIARKNNKRELADEIMRLRGGVIARGMPWRVATRKMQRRVEQETQARGQWVASVFGSSNQAEQARGVEEYGQHLRDGPRERLHEWLNGIP